MSRIYVVGTDTLAGKTAVCCALLRLARVNPIRVIPFKPAQSGPDDPSDAQRLLDAAGLPLTSIDRMAPCRFPPPLAPGLAENPLPFTRPAAANRGRDPAVLSKVADALDEWEAEHNPDHILIEGAGGFHVPMPEGTWQVDWIRTLADACIVVGRAGLGTINHSLLTIDACRATGMPVLGFYLSSVLDDRSDPSVADNATVIANARRIPHLGTLVHTPDRDGTGRTDLLSPLLQHLEA